MAAVIACFGKDGREPSYALVDRQSSINLQSSWSSQPKEHFRSSFPWRHSHNRCRMPCGEYLLEILRNGVAEADEGEMWKNPNVGTMQHVTKWLWNTFTCGGVYAMYVSFLYPPWLPSGKRTAEISCRHVQFYLMFVDREGERSVVSFVMVYVLWFYMGCCLCFDVYSHIMFYR